MPSHKMLFSTFRFNMIEIRKMLLRRKMAKLPLELQVKVVRKKTLKQSKKSKALFQNLTSVRLSLLRFVKEIN
jgi:hypothetical protein